MAVAELQANVVAATVDAKGGEGLPSCMSSPISPTIRFVGVSLDCPDPSELATFYMELLNGRRLWSDSNSVGVQIPGVVMVMQRVSNYRRPAWPGESIVHLDLSAGDSLDAPERRAIGLGAEPIDPQPDTRWRVLLDPAGHPFCITTVTPPQ